MIYIPKNIYSKAYIIVFMPNSNKIDTNLLITIGAVALGGFVIYKVFNDSGVKSVTQGAGQIVSGIGTGIQGIGEGVADASQGLGNGLGEIGNGIGAPFNLIDTVFDAVSNLIKDNQTKKLPAIPYITNTTQQIISKGDTIYGQTGQQIVSSIEKQARTIRNTSKFPSVTATPTYDSKSGTGVNSAGFGYSSMNNLGSQGTGTGVTIVNAKNYGSGGY